MEESDTPSRPRHRSRMTQSIARSSGAEAKRASSLRSVRMLLCSEAQPLVGPRCNRTGSCLFLVFALRPVITASLQ